MLLCKCSPWGEEFNWVNLRSFFFELQNSNFTYFWDSDKLRLPLGNALPRLKKCVGNNFFTLQSERRMLFSMKGLIIFICSKEQLFFKKDFLVRRSLYSILTELGQSLTKFWASLGGHKIFVKYSSLKTGLCDFAFAQIL